MLTDQKILNRVQSMNAKECGKLDALLSGYSVFQAAYRHDPAAFARDCIQWEADSGLADYQAEILDSLVKHHRIAVRSLHGAGKTMTAAIVVLWFALTRDGATDWKLAMTASAWRQLSLYLLPEIHKWARRLRWDKIGRAPFTPNELLTLNLKLSTGEAFAVASSDPAFIEGMHASSACYVYDEAKAIPEGIWDATEGAFSTGNDTVKNEVFALAISTPGEPQGRFFDIHNHKPGLEDWQTCHISLSAAIAAGRVSADWAAQRRAQWGEGSAVYQNRVLGEFATSQTTGIIPLAWVEAANERWLDWQAQGFTGVFTGVGVDVGGGTGGDKITLALCYAGVRVLEIRSKAFAVDPSITTMEVAGEVNGILQKRGGLAVVDVIGLGAGVQHRLTELGRDSIPFNAGAATDLTDISGELGFENWRAAGWWGLRELLDPQSGAEVCLPPDDALTGDLTAPHVERISSTGKLLVESKDKLRKRLGRSTDSADAVIQIIVGPLLWTAKRGAPQRYNYEFHKAASLGY
jgi:hypothetical protein